MNPKPLSVSRLMVPSGICPSPQKVSRSVVRKHHGQAAPPQTRHSIGWILYKQLLPLNRKLSSATGSAMLTSPSPFVLSAARQPGAAAPSRGSRGGPPSVIVVPTTARSTPALLESRTGSIRSPRPHFAELRVVVARTCLMFAGDCRLARPIRRSRAPRDLPARGILRRRAHNKKVRGRASELGAHLTFENGACGLRRAQSSPLTACTRPPPGQLPKPRRTGVWVAKVTGTRQAVRQRAGWLT